MMHDGKPLLKCARPMLGGSGRDKREYGYSWPYGHTAKWVAVVARAQKVRTAGAGDVEPPLSQCDPAEDVFSHTNDVVAEPWESLSRLPIMRLGRGSCACRPKRPFITSIVKYQPSVPAACFHPVTNPDMQQGSRCRPTTQLPVWLAGKVQVQGSTEKGRFSPRGRTKGMCGVGSGDGRDQNLYNRVWMCEDHSITTSC
ncbi:hypothetical protein VUR80DRAFT_2804 [Thermomyces stellatus]